MILTVDIGNSRIKWAVWEEDVIVDRVVSAYSGDLNVVLDEMSAEIECLAECSPDHVYALCVAGDKVSEQLDEWVRSNWRLAVDYLQTEKSYKNIINAYDDPARHGADRWAAIVAAYDIWPEQPLCVVCAGTAITIDLLKSDGHHLGGYILPSYHTMHSALLTDTADVMADIDKACASNRVPDNTGDAVNQGIHILLQSGIRSLYLKARQQLGERMRIIVTGGSARTIMQYPDMPQMEHAQDLIMQGLYNIMSQSRDLERSEEMTES